MSKSSSTSYACISWNDRTSNQSWTPLYDPIEIDGRQEYFDAFGRRLGDPYYGKVRTPAIESYDSDDVRYYCFSTSEERIIVYKETGATAGPKYTIFQ